MQVSAVGDEMLEVAIPIGTDTLVYKMAGEVIYTSDATPTFPLGVDSAFDTVGSVATHMAFTCEGWLRLFVVSVHLSFPFIHSV